MKIVFACLVSNCVKCVWLNVNDVFNPVRKYCFIYLQTPVNRYAEICQIEQFVYPFNAIDIEGRYDVAVLASFGHLIPRKIVNAFP